MNNLPTWDDSEPCGYPTGQPCRCCDLTVGCGRERMAQIRAEDPVFADYLDGIADERLGSTDD